MTTQLPPAGWYPDPSGKPGQMYWDGQQWHTVIPTTPPPAAAPTPWDQVRPHLGRGRRFWSGQSRERKVILALAGLLVVVALIAVPVAAFNYLFGGPDTSSPSYQQGLKAGTKGYAEVQAFGPLGGTAMPYEQACRASFNLDSADPSAGLVEQDYMQGCLYGLNHQSAQWTQTRKP